MKKKSLGQVFMNGILNENPTFRLLLGMCPTLTVSTAASQGLGMGLSTTFVLVFSNLVISMLRKVMEPLGAVFAMPQYSTDNAMGVAVLAHRLQEG